ncbi:MAG: S53 family peptidase [Candidatus Acidiferrales bacterium]
MKNNSWRSQAVGLCSFVMFTLAGTVSAQDFVYPIHTLHVQVSGPSTPPDCVALNSRETLICYSPAMIRAAYNYSATFEGITLDGAGQTIAIVEAYGSPAMVPTTSPDYSTSDLAIFDRTFAIPDPPSFSIVCPTLGCPVFSDTQNDEVRWAIETSLDVEWAHAMAPGASIVLVVAATGAASDINAAVQSAITLPGVSVISQSFGQPESLIRPDNAEVVQAHANYEQAQLNGITVLASAGDRGATDGSTRPNATYPASDPLVTAVGGTEGLPYPGGLLASDGYGGEQVWNEADRKNGIIGATGGAVSSLFPLPSFQQGLSLTSRTIPDVSYNAASDGGVLVHLSALLGRSGWYVGGGTGAGAPQWAAIIAMANQMSVLMGKEPLGYINPALYALAQGATAANDFHDITIGDNQLFGTLFGFPATPGYDLATGWGTPNVASLVSDLVNAVNK